jgi:predicted transglutaminase-like cysteine proteinase
MFPLTILGLAVVSVAVPLVCLFSLTVFSTALKGSDHRRAESLLPGAQALLSVEQRDLATASLAGDEPWRDAEGASFESRFPSTSLPLWNRVTARLTSVPSALQQGIQFIRFDVPTLAPMAFTRFCMTYPGECKPQQLLFSDDRTDMNKERWAELGDINRAVNSSISPERNREGLTGERWLLSPDRGDCNDYAVTKRHQLIAKGWSPRTVLLSEVVTAWGEHHLVTVVRTSFGDLVLDNLTDQILPWSRAPYRWVRIQMPKNPNYWASISKQDV